MSITGQATNIPSNNPATWNEFVFGLLDKGEMLIDDISVKDVTQGNVELIQNGSFSSGSARFWRIIGTHSGTVVPDPTAPANKVLKVTATAETEHMHNHATTTLKTGGAFHSIVDTDTYRITFRAKWLRGSNALHSRLYTNRLPLKTLLNRPTTGGTPGTRNSRFNANSGPTFNSLSHSPPVPSALRNATVSVRVADPDGVSSVQLFTSVNGAAFTSTPMTLGGNGLFTGTIPGQAAGTVVQFYVRATDLLGATSFFPARGAASRAMVQWDDGRALLTLPSGARPHNVRVILPPADATTLYRQENLMSNAAIPCTVILDEREIYYRAGVSLKSSEHGRFNIERVGYNLEFPPDDLYMGTHGGISIDRSGGIASGQSEILLKTLNVLAGGIHAPQDDLVRIIPACAPNAAGIAFDGSGMLGAAILSKTRLKGDYLDNQWDNGNNGMMFKYERIYELTQTIDPATRIVDPEIVPEHPKIPQDYTSPPGVDVANLGANPEFYRWHWLVESGRRTDDYSGIMNVTNAIGQAPGATFDALVDQYVDVDAWLRGHVGPVLFGTVDNYLAPDGRGSQHNVLFYFPPGKKAVVFPWDCDFLDQGNPGATLLGGDIAKFIENPAWKRLYFGHMLDVLNRSFNATTMSQWATHYSKFGTEDMLGMVSNYLIPRTNYARDVILGQNGQTAPVPRVAFERTSASPVTTSGSFTTVTGNAWIDVHEIRLQGATRPLPVTWTGESTWSLPLPLDPGTHTYTLVAYNKTGESLGTTTVTVSTISEVFPATANSLIVSELHYNPPGPDDTTEFIELQNITASTLDLSGCHFDEENGQGISYTFPNGVHLAPDARILIAKDHVAFLTAYPSVPTAQVAPGGFGPSGLDNNGERIKFYSAAGTLIFDFTYQDNLSRTDGGGRSLVRRVVSSINPNPLEYTWRASVTHGGNPGGTDALPFSGTITRDADGDGIAELLEYALGTSDSVSNPAPLTVTREVSGTLIAVFTRCANADAAVLSIEAVTDLKTPWAPANAVKTGDTLSGSFLTETWRITPPNGAANTFLRLKASLR